MRDYYLSIGLPVLAILCVGVCLLLCVRRHSAATKQFVCCSTLLAVLLIGIVPLLPQGIRPSLPDWMTPKANPVPQAYLSFIPHNSTNPNRLDLLTTGVLLAAAVSSLLVLRLAGSLLAAAHLRKSAQPASSRISQLASSDVRVVKSLSSPVAIGGFRPLILLPAEAEEWPEDQLRAVLIHEQAHLNNGDPNWQLLAEIVCSLHWFNPLVWLVRGVMRREAEKAADDSVLRSGIEPSIYAQDLVAFAKGMGRDRHSFAWTPFARKSGLQTRVHAILTPHIERKPMTKTTKITAIMGVLLAAYVTSAFTFAAKKVTPVETSAKSHKATNVVSAVEAKSAVKAADDVEMFQVVDENGTNMATGKLDKFEVKDGIAHIEMIDDSLVVEPEMLKSGQVIYSKDGEGGVWVAVDEDGKEIKGTAKPFSNGQWTGTDPKGTKYQGSVKGK